ncbi:MAG: hypothetical protein KatS3mg014_1199 [Actinomycetota bacterium]|nr:MAG: hypothetical protein KatS3mg014_1199 [Actinomycetota bacterium]
MPRITSTPRAESSPVTPFTSFPTMRSRNAPIASQSGSPAALIPHSVERRRVSMTSAERRSAFVGMQPRSRQVPPTRSSRSISPTRLPSCARRRAQE